MKCIHCCYGSLAPVHSPGKHKQQLKRDTLLIWLSTHATTSHILHKERTTHSRPNAIAHSLMLPETLVAGRGDVTVLLRTSTALFFLYWLANFVVPEIIHKDLQKKNKELFSIDDNAAEDEAGSSPISNPERKQKGFQSTKRN